MPERKVVARSFATLALAAALLLAAACGGGEGGGGGEQTAAGSGEGTAGMEAGRTITVASDIAYRPFEFYRNGEPVGFDIDLMREIGRRAGFTPSSRTSPSMASSPASAPTSTTRRSPRSP